MAVHVIVNVAYDPSTKQFTFTGGGTQANDGTANFDPGSGNTVTYVPVENQDVWFLTGVSWGPEGILAWEWLNDVDKGSIVVFDMDIPVNEAVEYSVTLEIEEVATMTGSGGGPVIINRPPDGVEQLRMSASS